MKSRPPWPFFKHHNTFKSPVVLLITQTASSRESPVSLNYTRGIFLSICFNWFSSGQKSDEKTSAVNILIPNPSITPLVMAGHKKSSNCHVIDCCGGTFFGTETLFMHFQPKHILERMLSKRAKYHNT